MKKLILLLLACAHVCAYGQQAKATNNSAVYQPTRVYSILNTNSSTFLRCTVSNNTMTETGGGDCSAKSSLAFTGSAKFCVEFTFTNTNAITAVGIQNRQAETFDMPGRCSCEWAYRQDGLKMTGGVTAAYGATWTVGDVITMAVDLGAGTIIFYKNGVSQGTAYTGLDNTETYWVKVGANDHSPGSVIIVNFGPSLTYPVSGYADGLYIN